MSCLINNRDIRIKKEYTPISEDEIEEWLAEFIEIMEDINNHIVNPDYRVKRGTPSKIKWPNFKVNMRRKIRKLILHIRRVDHKLTASSVYVAEACRLIQRLETTETVGEEGYLAVEARLFEIKRIIGSLLYIYCEYIGEEDDELVNLLKYMAIDPDEN